MKDKIKLIEFESKDEMRASLEQLKRGLSVFTEYAVIVAEVRKASYDAHIKQGFTPVQALELCKSMGI